MLTKIAALTTAARTLAVLPAPLPYPAGMDDWLPQIAPAEVAPLNALYRHRRRMNAKVAGHALAFETVVRPIPDPDACSFRLTLGGRTAFLRLAAALVDPCARSLDLNSSDRHRFEGFGDVQAGMLLELALLRPIKALESHLRIDIRILEQVAAIEPEQRLIPLHLLVSGLPGGGACASLFLDRQSAALAARALDAFAEPNAPSAELAIALRICVDSADLTLAELRSLRAGDIVMADRGPARRRRVVASVGERLHAELERVADGFRFVSKLVVSNPSHNNSAGAWFMQQPADVVQPSSIDDASLEQLPIRVIFEMGRLDLTLAEVRRLAPGYVLPISRPSDSAIDIMANGRRIGHGSLVKIGDSLGVRVERLTTDE